MATPKKVKKETGSETDLVVVLHTSVGHPLIIRSNPSDDAVRGFVSEHTRRYIAGEAGGPSGIPPYRIFSAERYKDEQHFLNGGQKSGDVDISDLLPA